MSFVDNFNDVILLKKLLPYFCENESLKINPLKVKAFNHIFVVGCGRKKYLIKVSPDKKRDFIFFERNFLYREAYFLKKAEIYFGFCPDIKRYGRLQKGEREYIVISFIDGKIFDDLLVRKKKRNFEKLYYDFGRNVRKLHSIRNKRKIFGYPGSFFRSWFDFILFLSESFDFELKKRGLEIGKKIKLKILADKLEKDFRLVKEPFFVHGDLWEKNILVFTKKDGFGIRAFIDFERAVWGDADFEWVFHLHNLPQSFYNGYGRKVRKTVKNDFYGLFFCINAIIEESIYFKRKKVYENLLKKAFVFFEKIKKGL